MVYAVYALIVVAAYYMAKTMAPKPATPPPATLEQFQIPTAEPGRPVPVAIGTVLITSPNIIWYGELNSSPVKTDGGK